MHQLRLYPSLVASEQPLTIPTPFAYRYPRRWSTPEGGRAILCLAKGPLAAIALRARVALALGSH